jgi:hypothetical protein
MAGRMAGALVVKQIILPNPNGEQLRELYEKELRRLRGPGSLQCRLADIDKKSPFRRIFVMGCGRSGTWLLMHVMSTFSGVETLPKELPIEYFGLLTTDHSVLVFKRDHIAYQRIEQIPKGIEIAYIVRHPYDVLTSHLPSSGRPYHILPDRWIGEMSALRHLVTSRRENTRIIRYEDLVRHPIECQTELGRFFDLSIDASIDRLSTVSNNPTESPMHRGRKIDADSINKHKRDPEKLAYLARIKPELGQTLDWIASSYDYDLSLS